MKKMSLTILSVVLLLSCGNVKNIKTKNITSVEIEHILQDSLLNVRALEIVKETNGAFFLTSSGKAGHIFESKQDNKISVVYPIAIAPDSIKNNFRSLALTSKNGFALSIESPARLYKIKNDENTLVYQENHPKAFYDALDFWNNQEGIAIGDPTDGCLSIIITRDGGNNWSKVPCENLPKAKEGEAAFAASDTNIAIVGNSTWVATGGKSSRILYSSNKGKTWEAIETPVIQGVETTGVYSIDFYDKLNGFAIGGDYTQPENNVANKIRTADGGKTWQLVASGRNPGYRSCVQYIPNSNGEKLVAVGFKGVDVSNDAGNTWQHISDQGFYTIRFVSDSVAYAAGAGKVSKLCFK
ncbi:oxidoreductase [Algibacter sp. L4_22]|uniref:WD40/YVTN/BNR-like repeat-containing protein n=1 Tax=Algibacter sp. L4_22 TaxID=2942477 RepID=UPI00201B8203|nr:oxidoreductase [Algibacter sp. L4_22]MCL5129502.1 oxidoreductase [Algibacter sp. L4_22]